MPDALTIAGLRVAAANGTTVVDDVSLSIRQGAIHGLVGESGCGKTTVAHTVLGYARRGLRIEAGAVSLGDEDLLSMSSRELRALRGRRVAYIPQDPSSALNPSLRIEAQIRMAVFPEAGKAETREGLATALERVQLSETERILRSYPHQLSGGQQQRVMLAMAFASRPSVIVLDEPTTGLDVTTQQHVLATIEELCRDDNTTALYVSHDLMLVRRLTESLTVMYAGEVVEEGSTAEVFAAPRHPYTEALIRAVPAIGDETAIEGIAGSQPRPGERGDGCLFHSRCPIAIDACLAARPPLEEVEGRQVRCIRAGKATLAEVTGRKRTEIGAGAGDAVLSVAGLCASYGATPILDHVGLDLGPQQCVAVVGESGSGKTTLARCIAGLHQPDDGELRLAGKDLARSFHGRSKAELRSLQYIFQSPYMSLNPRRTVAQSVAQAWADLGERPGKRKEREERVRAALQSVSLGDQYLNRYPDQLSGGERQRVAIARALIVEPEVLICDEITSALDVSVQATVVELLRELQAERRLSLVFITHNMALVSNVAQQVIVLAQGRVVEAGPVEDIMRRPSADYTKQLVADAA